MIEILIENKEIYEKLKCNAIYSSDITQVCAFRDKFAKVLKENGLIFEEVLEENKEKPRLSIIKRNVMKLDGAPAEMLHFVGVRSEFDTTIPLKSMNEIKKLIDANLIELDDSFKNLYSKMSYRNKVKDLVCSGVKFYSSGKLTDYLDGDLTIQSLKFSSCQEKSILYKQMKVEVTKPIEKKEKYNEMLVKNDQNEKIYLRFFNRALILNSIGFEGNIFSIASNKIIGLKNGYFCTYDPIILPDNLSLISDTLYTPLKRDVPILLFRNALYEFFYRYSIK